MNITRVNPVIVNFRTPDLTCKCVASILEHGVAAAKDIIVVENGSPDDSFEQLSARLPPGVQLIRATRNGGFGAGVNLGAAACSLDFVLVLNPDTYFEDDSLERVVRYFDARPDVGLVGLDLVYPGGERQHSARRFYSLLDVAARRTPLGKYWPFKSRMKRHLMLDAWAPGLPFEAEWVMGTGFLVRRALYERVTGMDEAYFLYMEDVDLCARVWQAGERVVCFPGARLVHDHQRSSAAGPFSWAGRMHLNSLMRFRSKFRVPLLRQPGIEGLWK
ncbi:MAG: glycosyl transferase family 2 [Azoarcus sp.]|uniref:Glycosyl transferase family 2 n=1 Tax=Parazoarcus communis TaxID=41977 RepID=A0A2U8GNS2_9RHOO|nr:glycosyltransferase family 2 protein [Parazoarcus communis]AWI75271.1 glycosyl transferase family 2 [Parazoarcus communis]PLX73365.1 MAG: glycosyl transferase family 2 [Azoarcus sp.]TVT56714.1 MAG: glycosyltransferase family 2 protein [Azoarcus sp. PHD]